MIAPNELFSNSETFRGSFKILFYLNAISLSDFHVSQLVGELWLLGFLDLLQNFEVTSTNF